MTSKTEKKRPSRRAEPANRPKAKESALKQARSVKAAKRGPGSPPERARPNAASTDSGFSSIAPPSVAATNIASTHAAPSDRAPSPAVTASKLDTIVALLRRDGGATLAELVEATGWQAHSVRGALAGSLKKKGYAVASSKQDGMRRYSLAS